MSSMECSHLPYEIMREIFLRASKDTIGRCRVASKELNKMTYDSKFIKLHSQRNNIAYWVFTEHNREYDLYSTFASINPESPKLSIGFVPGIPVCLVAVSAHHGIIVWDSGGCMNNKNCRFFVGKPRIKLFQPLPNPRTKLRTEAIAILVIRSNPLRYKILRISTCNNLFSKNYHIYICEVFDSETWTWKRLKNIMLPQHLTFSFWNPAVTVCGSFHWLTEPNLVMSFDMEKEEWKTHGLPVNVNDYVDIKLVKYEGKLALNCLDLEEYMHTWVMEYYINKVWKKKFVLNMKELDGERGYIPQAFHGSDVLVVTNRYGSLRYWDFKNREVLEKELKNYFRPHHILPFWSDSEPCCLRGTSGSSVQHIKEKKKKRARN